MKFIDITQFMQKADLVKDIYRESKALSQLEYKCKHYFILIPKNILAIIKLKTTFIYDEKIVLIMEYARGGELK